MPLAVTQQQRDEWSRNGFLVLPDLVPVAELRRLRSAYDEILDAQVPAEGDRMLGGVTRQVMHPSQSHPTFDRNPAVRDGISLGRGLFGVPEVHRTFDMLIYKPPGHPEPTPWHQDAAYGGHPVAAPRARLFLESIQIWVALDDVDEDTGCMHFVPTQTPGPLLEHRVASGDPTDDSRLLELVDPEAQLDLGRAVACPLPAGSATAHAYTTPHFTPPNASADRPRRAWIFNVATARGIRAIVGASSSGNATASEHGDPA